MQAKNMKTPLRAWVARCATIALLAMVSACGGGSSGGGSPAPATSAGGTGTSSSTSSTGSTNTTPPNGFTPVAAAANVVSIVVDKGTDGSSVDSPFVTVTVCVPGTSTCQAIDHVLVDTGSYGLRIAASALTTVPASSLPAVSAPGGAPLAECAGFVSGYAWGSVRTADVKISGETASAVPVQVVDDTGAPYASVPSGCITHWGPTNLGVGAGSRGILGVGFDKQDCGATCTVSTDPSKYFACPATGCVSSLAPLPTQVTSPVSLFATDNNGVVVGFPSVALGGASSVTGQMIFGIGTQANNQVGSNVVYTVDGGGNFTTTYGGQALQSFIDSGSNGIFFDDASLRPYICNGAHAGFYCPQSTLSLSATVAGINGSSSGVAFQVESLSGLSSTTAVAHLGGDIGGGFFDWGLPFFLGRTVFVAMRGATTPLGTGPYWAF